jgi:heme/copper-type cytochrome/quinol oxidase subunit 2
MILRSIVCLSVCVAATLFAAPVAAGGGRIVEIDAIPSRFSPDVIVVPAGETVTLRFSVTGVHGVYSPELGIAHTVLAEGAPTDVTISPKKPGTYVLRCRIFCGPAHPDMTLTVRVTA